MEHQISSAIVNSWFDKLNSNLKTDAIIVGGGPSGLVCAAELADSGISTAIIERKIAPGGGMWGGAMLFNKIVIQQEAIHILDEYNIRYAQYSEGLYVADSIEATSALVYNATHKGVDIFNGMTVEDVIMEDERVTGVVINWTAVSLNHMHVDPLTMTAKAVLDGTGHPCEVVSILTRKNRIELNLPQKNVLYERSMNAAAGERDCVKNTMQVFPGLFVSGMAACGVSGSNRMGPIFGGMLLSGKKAAKIIAETIGGVNKNE